MADIANDPGALDELRALGVLRVPVVMAGEKWVSGADLDAVAKLLQLEPSGHRMLPPQQLFEKYDAVLAKAQHYLAIFPQDRMSMTVPRRERRDMRQLGYHVFAIADDLMTVKEGDQYTQGNVPVPETIRTFGDIVAYGDQVRDRLRKWYAQQGADAWGRTLSTSYGTFPLHGYFERATWHSAQHLRQVVEMLRLAGSTDLEPPAAELFEGLPLPERLWE